MREPRDRFTASLQKRRSVNEADAAGQVCDSMEVRMALIARMNAGELTLEQVQAELKRIKREGKKQGVPTRAQVFSRS